MWAVEVEISIIKSCELLQELIGYIVSVIFVGVVLYHSHSDRYKNIGIFVDNGRTFAEEVGKVLKTDLAALVIFLYPVGFVHDVDAEDIFAVSVAFAEGLNIIFCESIGHFLAHYEVSPLVACTELCSAFEVVEREESRHNIDFVFFGNCEKLVKVCPVTLCDALYFARSFELDNVFARAVYPYSCAVHVVCRKLCKGLVPELFVHISVKVVPLFPRSVRAVDPKLLAVHHKLCAVNAYSCRSGWLCDSFRFRRIIG